MPLNTNEDDDPLVKRLDDGDDSITDDDENLKYEINPHANHYRLCKAKAMLSWEKINAFLAKKTLTATKAPHLDTKSLIAKLDDVAKTIDLDVCTYCQNKSKIHFLEQLDHGSQKEHHPNLNLPRSINQKVSYDFAKNSSDS